MFPKCRSVIRSEWVACRPMSMRHAAEGAARLWFCCRHGLDVDRKLRGRFQRGLIVIRPPVTPTMQRVLRWKSKRTFADVSGIARQNT